ncbi:MAG: hypothetical protein SFU86_24165 [Pirellulaceae bacterium]|nr:hypothetical protein [Pirellulaceae bacterium]
MADLAFGCVAMVALSAALFVLTAREARRLPPWACDLLAALLVAGMFLYVRTLWYDPRVATWLPVSNLIVVGNWLPLFAAAVGGLVWQRMTDHRARRLLVVAELGVGASLALVYPLLGGVPRCGDSWDKLGTCLQTTPRTCSAACAATLLSRHGIDACEQEMAELCLTRRGTSWQGLYRGLKLKTADTAWDVEIVVLAADELRTLRGPAILSVGLASSASANSDETREFGWIPGVNHSVILNGFNSRGMAQIADPALPMCREQWDHETLRSLWRGYAIRLVKRERP